MSIFRVVSLPPAGGGSGVTLQGWAPQLSRGGDAGTSPMDGDRVIDAGLSQTGRGLVWQTPGSAPARGSWPPHAAPGAVP